MEEFRASPFVECQGMGRCSVYTTALSYWMATIELNEQFKRPRQQTLKAGELTSRVSRCAVCMRNDIRRTIPPSPGSYDRYPTAAQRPSFDADRGGVLGSDGGDNYAFEAFRRPGVSYTHDEMEEMKRHRPSSKTNRKNFRG